MEEEKKQFKIGTTPGLYAIARPPDLASALRKFGFGITKGVEVLESIVDVPHEISYTEGKEIRDLAEKQGIEVLIHGALETILTYGEMEYWRRAQETLRRSLHSSIFCGASYVLFHACAGERWPETVVTGELPVAFIMVDELGRPIRERLKEEPELADWFVEHYWETYYPIILFPRELERLEEDILSEITQIRRRIEREMEEKKISREEAVRKSAEERERIYKEKVPKILREHLAKEKLEERRWHHEDRGNPVDIYRIMAQFLLMKRDPIVQEFEKMYERELRDAGLTLPAPTKPKEVHEWIEKLLRMVKEEPGRKVLGDFYHGIVASKYLEGHLKTLFKHLKEEFIEKTIPTLEIPQEEKKILREIAEKIKITIETPFLGGTYAGMMTLWHPRQIYAAIKAIRSFLKEIPELEEIKASERVFMTIDFEHTAVEGVDPYTEIPIFAKLAPDAGKYILSLHITKPHPLHHHIEVEIGDVDIYRLLWELRTTGLGRYFPVYLIFERGGEAEPYKRSITALKIMAEFLEKEIIPEELIKYPEFFGVAAGELASYERQLATIKEHAEEPLKGLIAIPEEEYTFLGREAMAKPGVPPEKWKREELK